MPSRIQPSKHLPSTSFRPASRASPAVLRSSAARVLPPGDSPSSSLSFIVIASRTSRTTKESDATEREEAAVGCWRLPLSAVKLNGRILSILPPASPSLSAPSGPTGLPGRVRQSVQLRGLPLTVASRPDRLPEVSAPDSTRPFPEPRTPSDSAARVQDAPIAKMEASSPIFPDREVARRPSGRTDLGFPVTLPTISSTQAADLELSPEGAVPVPATDVDVKSRADTPPSENRKERPNGTARSTGKYTTIV